MSNRNPRRGGRWDDRNRSDSFDDRNRGLSPNEGPYGPDEEYFARRERYGRGTGSVDDFNYRSTNPRASRPRSSEYGREDRSNYGRTVGYDRYDRGNSSRGADPWAGRSNFETGFTGWGTNKYEHNQYDPYWTSDEDSEHRSREMNRRRHWWDKAADEVAAWFGDDEAERRRQSDQRREGDFRGRGPKGYTRSDDRIKEDVNDRLTDDHALDASDIEVDVNNGEIVLSGTVDSRFEKRRAEDVAESVSGVRNVENRLRVNDYSRSNWNSESPADLNADRTDSGYYNGETGERSRGVGGTT